jgi:hypothetical protein
MDGSAPVDNNTIVITSEIDLKYCSSCYQKRPLPSFYKDPSASRVMATYAPYRATNKKCKNKQRANQQLDPDMPPPKRRGLKARLILQCSQWMEWSGVEWVLHSTPLIIF